PAPTGRVQIDDFPEARMPRTVPASSAGSEEADGPLPKRAPRVPVGEAGPALDAAWRAEQAVRNREIARHGIQDASELLAHRYRLPDVDAGFSLLRQASQRHNVKLHSVADAVNHVRPPSGTKVWFPGRARTAPPATSALNRSRDRGRAREWQYSDLTKEVLSQTLAIVGAPRGSMHVIESDLVRLEHQRNLDGPYSDRFAFVEDSESLAYWHLASMCQVIVHDLQKAARFLEAESHRVLLESGCRASHTVPLLDEGHRLMGVVWAHYDRPLSTGLDDEQQRDLDTVGAQAGAWLSWHRRTVLMDALEDLHHLATDRDPENC
ncbi:GAF and ANTAR domain-containing protein, partial [Streptomyces luteocolor]|uniref:GAF and ANTAR domain-containing protein n=1 Tax=Streptomyces luteocolor TaxID=285500 RepID=UPI0009A09CBE